MMIPLQYLARYAVPLVLAAIYLGDVEIHQQIQIFDKTMRLSDETLAKGRGEGEGNEVFDFIIVGGGSAGAVVTNRLSASGEHRVLLLEAGGDPNPIRDIMYGNYNFFGPAAGGADVWRYNSVKQNNSCGINNGFCRWSAGKVLGGGSTINGMMYNRGKPKDYDLWANFTKDQSWSWEGVKQTYNSIEDYQGIYEDSAGRHGTSGEVHIATQDYAPGIEILEEALREKAVPIGDLNGGDQTYGFSRTDRNIKDGRRWGTYQAFLEPILDRPNLIIYRYAYAIKVETVKDGEEGVRAVGVTYQRHGKVFTASATKEVVLSGGAWGSPKLLLLSGIGPKEHLDEVGIPTVLDLPVGMNLQEHMYSDVMGKGGEEGLLVNTTFGAPHNTTDAVLQYLHNGTGPFNSMRYGPGASHWAAISFGYTHSKQNTDMDWPDIQSYVFSMYNPELDKQEFFFSVMHHRSPTRGCVKLSSSDPQDDLIIDPNVFGSPEDMEILIDGVENMLDIFLNTTTFQRYGIQPLSGIEQCSEHSVESRDYWKCYFQYMTNPGLHVSSTCRMGPNSEVAVLDSKLKVFGTSNLRVIDASSFPYGPSGNINFPAMLVGARGAEIILSEQ